MRITQTTLREVFSRTPQRDLASPLLTYFPLKLGQVVHCFYADRRLCYNDRYELLSSQKLEFQFPASQTAQPALDFGLVEHGDCFYGILPQTDSQRAKLVEIRDLKPRVVREFSFEVAGAAQYALLGRSLVILSRGALHKCDLETGREAGASQAKFRDQSEVFAHDGAVHVIEHGLLSVTRIAATGEARRFLLQDGQSRGFCGERTLAGMPISHIQDIQFAICRGKYVVYKLFRHPEDVIRFLEQRKLIKEKIQQNPDMFICSKDGHLRIERPISPTTDCDVLFVDKQAARQHVDGEVLLIEKTDPRKGIYLQSLRYYGDLRSFYEVGYMLIDLEELKMYYKEGLVGVLADYSAANERFRLLYGDASYFDDFVDTYFGVRLNQLNNSSALVEASADAELTLSD